MNDALPMQDYLAGLNFTLDQTSPLHPIPGDYVFFPDEYFRGLEICDRYPDPHPSDLKVYQITEAGLTPRPDLRYSNFAGYVEIHAVVSPDGSFLSKPLKWARGNHTAWSDLDKEIAHWKRQYEKEYSSLDAVTTAMAKAMVGITQRFPCDLITGTPIPTLIPPLAVFIDYSDEQENPANGIFTDIWILRYEPLGLVWHEKQCPLSEDSLMIEFAK